MGSVSLHASKEVSCPYPLTVTAMHCVLCGRPACTTDRIGWLPVDRIWKEVQACHPDMARFPLLLCAEHKEGVRRHDSASAKEIAEGIIAVLKTGKTPSAKRGLDGTSIPKRAVSFGTLAVGACFHRLDRHGQPITDTTYARADTLQPGPSGIEHDIHNAISFEKIDAREGGKPRSYVFDDWLLVMPID